MAIEDAINKAQSEMGTPATSTYKKSEKNTYLKVTSGNVTYYLGDLAEPIEGTDQFGEPELKLYMTVDGLKAEFTDEKTGQKVNYQKKIYLDGTILGIDKQIEFLNKVKKFIKETGIEIPLEEPEKDEIAAAIMKYKKSKG